MKNIVITALNTRHTHSALALAYLQAYWEKSPDRAPLRLCEFDLNQTNEGIIAELILMEPSIVAFSVYIWSISRILVIAGALKAALPDITIIFGGPEVSYNSTEIMTAHSCVDYTIRGEGEITFTELLLALINATDTAAIAGITRREAKEVIENPDREFIKNLDEIPSPFRSGIYKEVHNFTYYEASRGCPSKCSYCLSSVLGHIRNHSIERVKKDLDWFFDSDYRQVRFADRTFNYDKLRAKEIISYIKQRNHRNINFHFEIQADFLSEEIIDLLADAPDGMFHLEIGVQSTNPQALRAVNRKFDLATLRDRVMQLKARTRCHLHLDLLGGLPFDGLADFYQSLDDVWQLAPHDIQISLVKVLRGTPLQKELANNVFFAMPEPPYTILRSRWLSGVEAVQIQDIGKLVEGIHNSMRFPESLKALVNHCSGGSASAMFASMVQHWRQQKLQFFNFTPENTARNLRSFLLATVSDKTLQKQIVCLIEHELRMAQRVPGADAGPVPVFEPALKKHPYRVTHGIRAFWYDYDPIKLVAGVSDSKESAVPVVYRFERDCSATPSIETIPLSLELAFALAGIQQRATVEALEATWKYLRPHTPVPDFQKVIEKLLMDELLYKP